MGNAGGPASATNNEGNSEIYSRPIRTITGASFNISIGSENTPNTTIIITQIFIIIIY